ncbi:DNA topoisomerase I [Candidatus Woesearchaeota archaeon]|nr:DNA topoisomerase I [Candidatus Woesearchaeota archaeon]
MAELIITEKPSSAKKVAEALSDGKLIKKANKKVPYYELKHKNKKIFVGCAVGHLFGLVEENKKGWTYPVFDIKWDAGYKAHKDLKYIKDYIDTLAMLVKKVDKITIACDYDVEGEVIGLNIVRFICKKKDANRMKFSTLTKGDLIEAYENKEKHLNWGQAHAGETRHKLDWYYGINLSRALTAAIKAAKSFKIMSIGRVQGPTLKLLVDREKEIQAFKPVPFWQLQLLGKVKKKPLEAWHKKDKFWDEKEVKAVLRKVKGEKTAIVDDIKKSQSTQAPPYPFDLTTLQTETYRNFGITPKACLAIAQKLYLAGAISYPRTSSQQLDPKLGFKKIMKKLEKQGSYAAFCQELLKGKLTPNNGKKTDPAHPAIYPTGSLPKGLEAQQRKVYDLIVKRFLATFGEAATRESMRISLDVKKEIFIAKGTRTTKEGWHKYYHPYSKLEDLELPKLEKGEEIKVDKINKIDKETQPPHRFNQSSIIKELEKRNLGTKATRADILDRLFRRGYVEGVKITVSKLGIETEEILEKYIPTIVDEELTKSFEDEMNLIREGKHKEEKVLAKAKTVLVKLLNQFKKKEKVIGEELLKAVQEQRKIEGKIGACPKCKGTLVMKRGKYGMFIACDKYPDCDAIFKVPGNALIKNSEKICDVCNYPKILVIRKGKRPQESCINPDCPSKVREEDKKLLKEFESGKVTRNCPKCGTQLVIRKSFYNVFLGCPNFPKCRHMENLDGTQGWKRKKDDKKEDKSKKSKK